jgi:Helix-turn-helix domain
MGQGSGRAHRLTCAERLELQRRVRAGETHEVAATALGCSAKSVQRLLVKTGGVKPRSTPQSTLRLSLPEREEISRGLLAGDSCRVIARRLGRAPSTVSRDVAAAGHRERYRAWRADETAHRRAHRPKIAKLIAAPRLRRAVERGCDCAGPRSKSPHGWSSTIPTIWRCVCPTRRSTNRSLCRGAGRCARSSRGACGRGARSVAHSGAPPALASCNTWC